jgi:hypothetical protein
LGAKLLGERNRRFFGFLFLGGKLFGERKPEVVLIVFKSVGRKEPGVLEKIR